jgi:hypothetical protein
MQINNLKKKKKKNKTNLRKFKDILVGFVASSEVVSFVASV